MGWHCRRRDLHADLAIGCAPLLKGGMDGPVLIPGKMMESRMIHRLLLPLIDGDHMPPDGKPQPILAEIVVLQWWVEHGAPANKTVGDLNPGRETQRPSSGHTNWHALGALGLRPLALCICAASRRSIFVPSADWNVN
jgi:hypothetical protein